MHHFCQVFEHEEKGFYFLNFIWRVIYVKLVVLQWPWPVWGPEETLGRSGGDRLGCKERTTHFTRSKISAWWRSELIVSLLCVDFQINLQNVCKFVKRLHYLHCYIFCFSFLCLLNFSISGDRATSKQAVVCNNGALSWESPTCSWKRRFENYTWKIWEGMQIVPKFENRLILTPTGPDRQNN